jgi:hypothetical protein
MEPLHPYTVGQRRTRLDLGCGRTVWFGLVTEPTPGRNIRVQIETNDGENFDLEMSQSDAVEIIRALSKAVCESMTEIQDEVGIKQYEDAKGS